MRRSYAQDAEWAGAVPASNHAGARPLANLMDDASHAEDGLEDRADPDARYPPRGNHPEISLVFRTLARLR